MCVPLRRPIIASDSIGFWVDKARPTLQGSGRENHKSKRNQRTQPLTAAGDGRILADTDTGTRDGVRGGGQGQRPGAGPHDARTLAVMAALVMIVTSPSPEPVLRRA